VGRTTDIGGGGGGVFIHLKGDSVLKRKGFRPYIEDGQEKRKTGMLVQDGQKGGKSARLPSSIKKREKGRGSKKKKRKYIYHLESLVAVDGGGGRCGPEDHDEGVSHEFLGGPLREKISGTVPKRKRDRSKGGTLLKTDKIAWKGKRSPM